MAHLKKIYKTFNKRPSSFTSIFGLFKQALQLLSQLYAQNIRLVSDRIRNHYFTLLSLLP